jgi:serine protease Do
MRRAATTLTLCAVLASLAAPPSRAQDQPAGEKPADPKPAEAPRAKLSLADFEDAFLEVADKVRPGVVAIEVRHAGEDAESPRDILFSGVVWDRDGTIVAIGRDLESANEILVSPFEGEAVKAHFLGADDETGICVLKLTNPPGPALRALEHGPPDGVRAGSFCISVGNPVGLRHSVAFGHVAATGRTVRRGTFVTKDAIQVTLPVNPGDPGGLLADSRGRMIGVLASSLRRSGPAGLEQDMGKFLDRMWKGGSSGGNGREPGPADLRRAMGQLRRLMEPGAGQGSAQNVSFAIPVAEVARAVERVRKSSGKPWLGVDVGPIEEDERKERALDGDRGVLVIGVRDGSPAAKAGLKTDDVVLTWNGQAVKGTQDLKRLVMGTQPGAEIKLEILRGKDPLKLSVTIESRSGEKSSSPQTNGDGGAKLPTPPEEKKP